MNKKILFLSIYIPCSLAAFSQVIDIDGVPFLENTYVQKISSNGNWIVGMSDEGGTVVYNRETGKSSFDLYMDYGRGHCVSDKGWVVGNQLLDDDANIAKIYSNGEKWTPSVFNLGADISSNIHSITPDGSRICGVVGDKSKGFSNLPFVCDIDATGNVGEIQYLPFPTKDFFGDKPQYCSATWLSDDGKTVAGQIIDSRGFAVFPIIYKQASDGSWSFEEPSKSLFNPNNLPLPEPVGDIEEMFPDIPFPDIQNYMSAIKYMEFLNNGQPYDDLEKYMTPEQLEAYYEAVGAYQEVQEIYNTIFEEYDRRYWEIYDSSVIFVRNAMALSGDSKWLASSSQYDDISNPDEIVGYYIPYLCNLETGEWVKCSQTRNNYITNQVLPGGITVMNSLASDEVPASTFLYYPETKELRSLYDVVSENNAPYKEWYDKYLTGEFVTDETGNGNYEYGDSVTVTGQAAISQDFSVVAAGVDGYMFFMEMYFSYVFENVKGTGIESVAADSPEDGIYRVYNLQGIKINETKEIDDIRNLNNGIYIINGKKVGVGR